MRTLSKLITALMLIPIGMVHAASVGLISLHDAIMLALRNNPTILSAELDRVTQKFSLAIAYHAYEPQWSWTNATGSYTHTKAAGISSYSHSTDVGGPAVALKTAFGTEYKASMSGNRLDDDHYNPKLLFSVDQPLWRDLNKDLIMSELIDAIDNEKMNQLELRDTIAVAINSIITDYRAIISAEQQLLNQQTTLKQQMQNIAENKLQVKAGTMSMADEITAEAQLPSQQLSIVQNQNTLQNAKQLLLQDLGLDPNTEYVIDDKVTIPNKALLPLEKCIELAFRNSLEYNRTLLARKRAFRALLKAQDAARWQLNLHAEQGLGAGTGGSPNANPMSLINGQNYNRTVSLTLNVPIERLPLQQAIVNAKITLAKNTIEIKNQQNRIKTDIINRRRNLLISLESLRLAAQNVTLSQKVLDQSLLQQRYGQIGQFQVNTNRQTLITSQQTLITTQIAYLNDLTTFNRLLGITLNEWHLKVRY